MSSRNRSWKSVFGAWEREEPDVLEDEEFFDDWEFIDDEIYKIFKETVRKQAASEPQEQEQKKE